jgi:hypothetical protein
MRKRLFVKGKISFCPSRFSFVLPLNSLIILKALIVDLGMINCEKVDLQRSNKIKNWDEIMEIV